MTTRFVIGCMTGTSIDGLDAALVRIEGTGLAMRAQCVAQASRPLGALSDRLRALANQEPLPIGEAAELARAMALIHVSACNELVSAAPGKRVDLISIHGQTVYHKPPASMQLVQPAVIAHELTCPVVSDLRAADIAAGGQGAPLTPIADMILFGDHGPQLAIVNLGGFANGTLLCGRDVTSIRANDICACNQLLDTVARQLLRVEFDAGGGAALQGEVRDEPLEDLLGIFASQRGSKRSLGTGDETTQWVSRFRAHFAPHDLAATACEAIGSEVACWAPTASRLLLAGGGVRNAALTNAISANAHCPVHRTDSVGVPAEFREAIAWAVLGALSQDRVAIGLPQVTGVQQPAPIAGAWIFP